MSKQDLINIKTGCTFIAKFCSDRKITLDQYKTYTEGTIPAVVVHLQNKSINFYIIHGLECEKTFRSLENELLEFIITEYNKKNRETRTEFIKSTTLKQTTRKALQIIEQVLLKNNNRNKQENE